MLEKAMAKLKAKLYRNVSVTVGYTAAYAVYVHENLQARHPVGQAKFLSQPMHDMTKELSEGIVEDMRNGRNFEEALLRAGYKLQAASQKLCPVDTGALRASAFTRLDDGQP